jgi:hypothetical protein
MKKKTQGESNGFWPMKAIMYKHDIIHVKAQVFKAHNHNCEKLELNLQHNKKMV